MARRNYSLVHWYPDLEKHKCGYCKQSNSNCSYGMWAQILTVEDYQFLIDRGWRRSGKYCYKPVMDVTCCPLYTIRCESVNFKPSKSQKKIIKRVNRYLSDSFEDRSNESVLEMESDDAISNDVMHEKPNRSFDLSKIETEHLNSCVNSALVVSKTCENDLKCEIDKPIKMSTSTSSLITKDCKAGKGVDPTKPPCKKAKLLRLERKQQKLAAKGINITVQNSVKSQGKTLEEFINDVSESPAHRLKVCLVRTGGSTDLPRIRAQEYPIYRKYQMTIHGDAPEKCTEKQFNSFLCDSPLQIVLTQMNPNEPSFKDSAKLFAKYQMFVHGESEDDCDFSSFENFLVETPLEHCEDPTLESGFGSFHQQYWLDDKLIAVGVIDILPKCISSVYFFYDPDYRHLTLGTYGSLRELFYVRQLQHIVPDLKYYYMGYYIHTCPKMRYKANLSPSFLLCPETYNWFAIENCILKLDKQKYSRFNEDLDAVDKDGCTMNDIDELMILISYKGCVPFKFYKEKIKGQEDDFYTFGNLIGKTCIPRIIISSRHADF